MERTHVMLEDGQLEQAMAVATQVATRYRRRCWWADEEELRQEILAALCKATWDPRVGVPYRGYAWRVGLNVAKAALVRESAPVATHDHAGRAGRHAGLRRAALHDAMPDTALAQDAALHRAREQHRVGAAVRSYLKCCPDSALAMAVLLDDDDPEDVAARAGVPLARVRKAVRIARQSVAISAEMLNLWKET